MLFSYLDLLLLLFNKFLNYAALCLNIIIGVQLLVLSDVHALAAQTALNGTDGFPAAGTTGVSLGRVGEEPRARVKRCIAWS